MWNIQKSVFLWNFFGKLKKKMYKYFSFFTFLDVCVAFLRNNSVVFCKNLIYFGFVLFYVPSSKRQRVSKSVTRLTLPCFSGAEFVVEDVVADAEVAEEGDCDAISPVSFLLFIVSSTLILSS